MTKTEALRFLDEGGSLVQLAEAVGTLVGDSRSTPQELMRGLRHPGVVAEQAALALYRRLNRPLPPDRSNVVTDYADWMTWLLQESLKRGGIRVAHPEDSTTATLLALAEVEAATS